MPSERVGADHSVTGGHTASCLTSLSRRRPSAGQAVHRIDMERRGAVTTELPPKLSKSKRQGRLHGRPSRDIHQNLSRRSAAFAFRPFVHLAATGDWLRGSSAAGACSDWLSPDLGLMLMILPMETSRVACVLRLSCLTRFTSFGFSRVHRGWCFGELGRHARTQLLSG